jgi:hypothetical protein
VSVVADTIAVSEAEQLVVLDELGDAAQPAPGHCGFTGIHQRYLPRLGALLMNLHAVLSHVEGHVGHVQKVVGEVLFDHVALVAAADDEVVDAVGRVHLHDVPQDRLAADFDHRLGAHGGFFAESGAKATGQYHGFHRLSRLSLTLSLNRRMRRTGTIARQGQRR